MYSQKKSTLIAILKAVNFALLFLLIIGCAASVQQELSSSQLSSKAFATLHRTEYIGIASIDGKARFFTPSNLKIAPGKHLVSVRITAANAGNKTWDLDFVALENHTYDIIARPCSMGGDFIDGMLIGFTPSMWEAIIIDRNTNQIVATDGSRDIKITDSLSLKENLAFRDKNIEFTIEDMGFVDSVRSLLYDKVITTKIGETLFVIKLKISKIENILVGGFGFRGKDLSQIFDEKSNKFPLKYWHTISGYKLHGTGWIKSRPVELLEGASILFCFSTPYNFLPTKLTLVYYYQTDFGQPQLKGYIVTKLTE